MARTKTEEAAVLVHAIKEIFENIQKSTEEYLAEDVESYRNPDLAMEKIASMVDKYNKL